MIPQRVKLSGFLSYKDEQEIRFDGSQLWMLSGSNGSGKSSIFDAVTFALFGHHRGGSQSATELINKESNTLGVEFDFTIEGQLYRIKRTVRRRAASVASTQQVLRYIADLPGPIPARKDGAESGVAGNWEPIPDTQLRARFDAWVKDKIGLDYETFTSSVLLLQGKSEKLLDSTPAGRAGVLARIVDLERYQKLHARADEKRRELKSQLEAIGGQLAAIRDVTDEELAAALSQIEGCERLQAETQDRIDRLANLEIQARNWADKQKNLASARNKLHTAESLLGTAVAIEKDHARLKELRDVLPAVGIIVTERGRIQESERRTDRLVKDRDSAADRRRLAEHALDQARKKLASLKKTLAEDETRQGHLNTRLRELSAILEKVKQVEDAEAEVRRLEQELKSLPANPEAAARKLQQEQDRLERLAPNVAWLERLHRDRSDLTKAVAAEKHARTEEARLKAEGLRAREALTILEAKAKAAREDRAARDSAAAEARALARQARELADEFRHIGSEKVCRVCGSPLTPEHLDAERKRRDLDARAAERKCDALTVAAVAARKHEEELTAKEAEEREQLGKLRENYRDASAAVKQAAQDIQRLTEACRNSYFALPDEFKKHFGPSEPENWAAVAYPDRHQIAELAAELRELDSVKRQLKAAAEDVARVQTVKAKLDSARARLDRARQGLPADDPTSLRQEYAAKQTEDSAVANQLRATKKEITATEAEVDRQQRSLNEIDRELVEISGRLQTEEVSRKQAHEAVDRAKRQLPTHWQIPAESAGLNDRVKWQEELDTLTARKTEAKFSQLQAARGGLESLRAEIAQLEQEAEAFPPEARRDPAEVRTEVAAAQDDMKARNRDLLDAQRQKGILDEYRRQRAELGERFKTLDAEHARHKTLTELLGRDRLQRHLVRQAERQIVDYANAVLDRLSGGQLFLRLVGTDDGSSTDKALELECYNRVTGAAPINVAFLSGSQKFRVAVALALGIGQYASKQHRPIESVIIDEGFGCLDRAGRQVMIQELQNLRGHLHCILLVSHQEEFADAFPDGYRFELHQGATRVSRFER